MNKYYKFSLIFLLSLAGLSPVIGQSNTASKQGTPGSAFTAVFYNVENLFDTINDPAINDEDFTPQGRIPWTSERFLKKEKNLAQVFSSVVAPRMPDIIGMAEVENKYVLEKLILQQAMKSASYGIVHFESPDERGIDVALLYNKKTFTVTHSEPLKVTLETDKTRDILFVTGKTSKGIELNIFINHWPSRREGTDVSENKRMAAAAVLNQKVRELLTKNSKANILIMGDFNDNPDNKSITEGIKALPPTPPYKTDGLYDLLQPRFKAGKGSLYYKSWDLFDQIIVSGNLLLSKSGLSCSPEDAGIFDAKWLMFTNSKGEDRPNRTAGSKYFGGYSDHLPVFLTFKIN
jgi:predicted extracellular nuclease